MFAYPLVYHKVNDRTSFYDGLLFRLAPELAGATKLRAYAEIAKPGWHKIEFGALAFVYIAPDRSRFCFPGIFTTDQESKNSLKLPCYFSTRQFEAYIAAVFEREDEIRRRLERDLNLVVHDLRRLSTAIYHAAEEAREFASAKDFPRVAERIQNIIAAQTMLTIRTDVLDFAGNPNLFADFSNVPIYKRVHKVVRCFEPIARRSQVDVSISGTSFDSAYGPNTFEIIPYILIDNAVKYAPRNSTVDVSVNDSLGRVNVLVRSIGPEIRTDEQKLIFEKGYRGEVARDREDSGSGLGLFLCKKMVDQFKGSILVEVGGRDIVTSKGVCRDITFSLSFPVSKHEPT